MSTYDFYDGDGYCIEDSVELESPHWRRTDDQLARDYAQDELQPVHKSAIRVVNCESGEDVCVVENPYTDPEYRVRVAVDQIEREIDERERFATYRFHCMGRFDHGTM